MKPQKRSERHEQRVQELRRSHAAGVHGDTSYNRKPKYPIDWLSEMYDDGLFDNDTARVDE